MGAEADEGQDGTSIKPVSSLRSHFEQITKDKHQSTCPVPLRATSPFVAKPQDGAGDQHVVSSSMPPLIPRERPSLASIEAYSIRNATPRLTILHAPPQTFSPTPIRPLSLLIDPSQSRRSGPPMTPIFTPTADRHVSILSHNVPRSTSTPSTDPHLMQGQPHARGLNPRRSPLPAMRPPSPPPARRSAETRKKETSQPSSSRERPLIPARPPHFADALAQVDGNKFGGIDGHSSSIPPSRSSSVSDDGLGASIVHQPEHRGRSKASDILFEPPPLHHSIMNKRRVREPAQTGIQNHEAHPRTWGTDSQTSSARQRSVPDVPRSQGINALNPPPRPSNPPVLIPSLDIASSSPPKRVVSTPTLPLPLPPGRPLSRTMTLNRTTDRTSERTPLEPTTPSFLKPSNSPSISVPRFDLFPDASNVNRRPPRVQSSAYEISTKMEARVFDVCGEYICATGQQTLIWNLVQGEQIFSLGHADNVKGTAVLFKPATQVREEGSRIWIGNSHGELLEIDVAARSVVTTRPAAHGRLEIIKIYRHFGDIWTLDEGGSLHVWSGRGSEGPSLDGEPNQTLRVPRGHTFSLVIGDELWHAAGKEVRVFRPLVIGQAQFSVLPRPLIQDYAGEVTSGALLHSEPNKLFLGHTDGKISIYDYVEYSCLCVVTLSSYKINTLAGINKQLWAAFSSGRIAVYDLETSPWTVKKNWQAHDNSVFKLTADTSSLYHIGRFQAVSLGADRRIRIWDGLLPDDWLENDMKAQEARYCQYENIKMMVMTWNVGASTPHSLRSSNADGAFIKKLLDSSDSPDILVFGFQELVDLEDKTAAAKRLFSPLKKKEGSEHERMSHQYCDWRDFLRKSLDSYMPSGEVYHLLHTSTLVGLFTCIFVSSTVRGRVRNLSSGEVKRGMGGLDGNKGAIMIRFLVDDTSLCFINCHLAAGQTHATQRHHDVTAILDSTVLTQERDPNICIDNYVGGGDGSMVLDHEVSVLNGDLNYRIDTMSRDTVVGAVKAGNLGKILERDQLLVARRRNQGFKLRLFDELPISFPPTYKFDVGTDNYDTSEKKRSPAWCDRLLYRGGDRIRQLDYRSHEVRVSDHRPVSGRYVVRVKRIDAKRRADAWADCLRRFEDVRRAVTDEEKPLYLMSLFAPEQSANQRAK